MAGAPSAWTQFFAELKRRRVVRVAAVYLAAAFVVIQAAPSLFQALLLPDWAFRLLVVLLILGFLIAVPLAWAYDLGPSGIKRTPSAERVPADEPDRRSRARWWPVVAGLALFVIAVGGWLVVRERKPAINPRLVVVAAFENQTGDAAFAPVSNMAADWITQGLSQTGVVEVADAPTALTVAREAGLGAGLTGIDAVRRLSRETGAALVVTGRYYRQGDSLAFVAQIVDARAGKVVRAVGPVTASATSPIQGAEGLRQRLMAELAVLLDDRLARFQALERQPPAYDAYREYMDGLAGYLVSDITAVDHFERAFALDSTFYRALLWAAQCVLAAHAETPVARYDTLLARVTRLRTGLTPAEQHQLDFLRAARAGDMRAVYAAARLRWEASPGSDDALREFAGSASHVFRFREATELRARIDWNRGLLRGFPQSFGGVASGQHRRGDFAGELRTAAEYSRRAPDSYEPDAVRLRALAALGRTEELRALASRVAERLGDDPRLGGVPSDVSPIGEVAPFQLGARELNEHGNVAAAQALARDGVSRCVGLAPGRAQIRPEARLGCADLLGFLGRWPAADSLLRGMQPPPLLRLTYLTYAAMAAARLGDRARALALSDSLARQPVRTCADMYAQPSVEYRRAMIAAALGDREDALRRLRLWRTRGDWTTDKLRSEPIFIPYFSDPRFRKLLESDD